METPTTTPAVISVRLLRDAHGAHAMISYEGGDMTVALDQGIGAVTSLERSVAEMRRRAEQLLRRARIIEAASFRL